MSRKASHIRLDQLTLRGFDPELQRKLNETAKERKLSLNKAALLLMRRGAGLVEIKQPVNRVNDSLDQFVGLWSEEEAKEFEQTQGIFETIDQEMWT